MAIRKLTCLEIQIMEALWTRGASSVREIHEAFPVKDRPAHTTIQTTVNRLDGKYALRFAKWISNAHSVEAIAMRAEVQGRLIDDMFNHFVGRARPLLPHLVETGQLTLDDVKDAKRMLSHRPGKGIEV